MQRWLPIYPTPYGFPADFLLEKRRAKAKLFRQIMPGGVAVVNAADPHAEILGGINLDVHRVAYALESEPRLVHTVPSMSRPGSFVLMARARG